MALVSTALLFTAVLTLGLAASSPARAQALAPQPGVLLVRAHEEDASLARALAQRLSEGALGDGRDLALPPPPRRATFDEGWLARTVLEAEDHFARFSLSEAREVLSRAEVRLDRDGPRGVSTPALIELFLLSARIEQALGEADRATRAVRAALAVDRTLVVDEERHPPTVTALVEAERGAMSDCALRVALTPPEAQVAVDGGSAGSPPTSLPCGEHWLDVVLPGYESESHHVILDASTESVSITLRLDAAVSLAMSADAAPLSAPSALAERAAASLGRALVVLDVAREGDRVVVALGDRRVRAPLSATPDEVMALLRAAGRVEGGFDVGLAAGTIVGATLAVAALVTVLAVVLSQPPPSGFELRGEILP